jgi:hypothetical protein
MTAVGRSWAPNEEDMSNQVVHVSEECHAALIRYCAQNKLQMTSFVSGIIVNEIKRQREIEAAARAMRVVKS